MKRTLIFICILLSTLFCFTGCASNVQSDRKAVTLSLVYEKDQSMLHDFTVNNGKAYIICDIVVTNNSGSPLSFKMKGDFKQDKQGGLLKDDSLYAFDRETNKTVFTINNNSTQTYTVDFVGDYGGTNQKHDRLPPPSIEFEVQ